MDGLLWGDLGYDWLTTLYDRLANGFARAATLYDRLANDMLGRQPYMIAWLTICSGGNVI